jgi:hypothetical protein
MTGRLPRQIDRRVRRVLDEIADPWELVKKRDHYFVRFADGGWVCVANNSSKTNDWQVNKTIEELRKRG